MPANKSANAPLRSRGLGAEGCGRDAGLTVFDLMMKNMYIALFK
jgi:hypothetical protein